MNNFLNFIEEDIEVKKVLLSTMPKKNQTSINKYNDKLSNFIEKYEEYEMAVRNYLIAKSNSFKVESNNKEIDKQNNKVTTLEYIKFLLNPSNTYFEKMGFDNLLYRLINYYEFNIDSLTDIINQFFEKFDLITVKLTVNDFNYTCYVKHYINSYLDAKNGKISYDVLSQVFEEIYWVNPEIIQHIELNFRKIIRKYENKFISYIENLKKDVMKKNNIINYSDCLEKLKQAYIDLNFSTKETLFDIVNLAKNNNIDMTQYFSDSKFRMATYDYLIKDFSTLNQKEKMNKVYISLDKLKNNVKEYAKYVQFMPLFEFFKNEYGKQINDDSKKTDDKQIKLVLKQIEEKEKQLEKINKKICDSKVSLFDLNIEVKIKQLRINSIQLSKELYELYTNYDKEYFASKVKLILNNYMTLSDLLNLYYSYDYFKKIAMKSVFQIETYEDLNKYSEDFDLFAMNPLNIITTGTLLFDEVNIGQIIINKYKIDDIYLDEDLLNSSNLDNLVDKIDFMLRVNTIENSNLTVDQIWFISQVEKIILKEKAKA